MKYLVILFFFLFFATAYSDDKSTAETGATVKQNLSAELKNGKLKAMQVCSACHGIDGVAASGGNSVIVPNLTAQHKDYLISKLTDYKTGKIQHAQMTVIAGMLTEQDIHDVSEWYSRIKIRIFDPNLVLAKPSE
tara:strand:+ start:439 stop:843 length:405 start_codon:yes stop_codon:yes gene_type:complete